MTHIQKLTTQTPSIQKAVQEAIESAVQHLENFNRDWYAVIRMHTTGRVEWYLTVAGVHPAQSINCVNSEVPKGGIEEYNINAAMMYLLG